MKSGVATSVCPSEERPAPAEGDAAPTWAEPPILQRGCALRQGMQGSRELRAATLQPLRWIVLCFTLLCTHEMEIRAMGTKEYLFASNSSAEI